MQKAKEQSTTLLSLLRQKKTLPNNVLSATKLSMNGLLCTHCHFSRLAIFITQLILEYLITVQHLLNVHNEKLDFL